MKGTTTITLTSDSVAEALTNYLNAHLKTPITVESWMVDVTYQPTANVIVKFSEVKNPNRAEEWKCTWPGCTLKEPHGHALSVQQPSEYLGSEWIDAAPNTTNSK